MKNNAGFQTIALSRIHESTTNPRSIFDESKLAELAASLRTQGLIQPITVRPNSDGYEIVAGARRFRAAQLAELTELPVRIVQLSDEQSLEWQIIENSQRVDVHPYEEAQGYQRLLDLPGYDVATLAEKTGKSDSHIYARLALLQLIPEVAEAFQTERITASHANLISRSRRRNRPRPSRSAGARTIRTMKPICSPPNTSPHGSPTTSISRWTSPRSTEKIPPSTPTLELAPTARVVADTTLPSFRT